MHLFDPKTEVTAWTWNSYGDGLYTCPMRPPSWQGPPS